MCDIVNGAPPLFFFSSYFYSALLFQWKWNFVCITYVMIYSYIIFCECERMELSERKCECVQWHCHMSCERWMRFNIALDIVLNKWLNIVSKIFIFLFSLSYEWNLSIIIGVITGHIKLNGYFHRIGIEYDFCGHTPETSSQFLWKCSKCMVQRLSCLSFVVLLKMRDPNLRCFHATT